MVGVIEVQHAGSMFAHEGARIERIRHPDGYTARMRSTSSPSASQKARQPTTHSAVLPPRWELASCVRAFVTRSTVGAPLQAHERHNFYPATIACAISWTVQGQTELVRVGDQVFNAMATSPVVFSGPQTQPCETRNPAHVQFFLLLLLPDAFHALTGIDLQAHVNQHRPLDDLLPDDWQAMAGQAMAADHDAHRIEIIEAFLLPRWQAARPHSGLLCTHFLTDWVNHFALKCATSAPGKSLRQLERRVKQWTGQTQHQLQRMVRREKSFLQARELHEEGKLSWSAFAADKGFSDQSHLCREFRKLTGFQPGILMDSLDRDERLWIYKAW